MRPLPLAITAAALAAASLAACSSASSSSPPAVVAASTAAGATASAACKLKTTFDYIERTTEPGLQASALEIGNVDDVNCTDSLSDFQAQAGQADGECTAIALASKNPGYNVDTVPAPPLKDVIESAGPGCR